jgi:hypothetical protein
MSEATEGGAGRRIGKSLEGKQGYRRRLAWKPSLYNYEVTGSKQEAPGNPKNKWLHLPNLVDGSLSSCSIHWRRP